MRSLHELARERFETAPILKALSHASRNLTELKYKEKGHPCAAHFVARIPQSGMRGSGLGGLVPHVFDIRAALLETAGILRELSGRQRGRVYLADAVLAAIDDPGETREIV
jgi:hypothetical protein